MRWIVSRKMVMIEKNASINRIKQSDHNLMHAKSKKISSLFSSRLYLLKKKALKSIMNKNLKILQIKMRKANFSSCRFRLSLNRSTKFLTWWLESKKHSPLSLLERCLGRLLTVCTKDLNWKRSIPKLKMTWFWKRVNLDSMLNVRLMACCLRKS